MVLRPNQINESQDVNPAKAGIQFVGTWTPACAGVTGPMTFISMGRPRALTPAFTDFTLLVCHFYGKEIRMSRTPDLCPGSTVQLPDFNSPCYCIPSRSAVCYRAVKNGEGGLRFTWLLPTKTSGFPKAGICRLQATRRGLFV